MPYINFYAVGLSTLAAIILGFFWYSDALPTGKLWLKEMGFKTPTKEENQKMMKKMMGSMAIYFTGTIVLMYTFFHMLATYKTMNYTMALQGAFWTWFGFMATIGLSSVTFEGKSWKLYFLNQAFNFLMLLIASLIYVAMI